MADQTTDSQTAERLAALETAVAELRRELEEARRPQMRSMRATRRCPACGGRRLLHCRRIRDVAHGSFYSLSLQKTTSSFLGAESLRHQGGELEVYACRECRLVEWHAARLDNVNPDGKDVFAIEGRDEPAPPAAPYR